MAMKSLSLYQKEHALVIIGAPMTKLCAWVSQLQCEGQRLVQMKKKSDEDDDDDEVEEEATQDDPSYKPANSDALISGDVCVYNPFRGSFVVLKPIDFLPFGRSRSTKIFGEEVSNGIAAVLLTSNASVPSSLKLDPILYYSCPVYNSHVPSR
jgi:hypothetical protein